MLHSTVYLQIIQQTRNFSSLFIHMTLIHVILIQLSLAYRIPYSASFPKLLLIVLNLKHFQNQTVNAKCLNWLKKYCSIELFCAICNFHNFILSHSHYMRRTILIVTMIMVGKERCLLALCSSPHEGLDMPS